MNPSAPIELNIYDEKDEVVDTLRRSRIPSYLLDMAIQLQEQLAGDASGQQNSDALFDFIVEFYKNEKYDRNAIKKGTDLIECMTVLRSIITRASALTVEFARANPQVPSRKKK